MSIFNKIVFIAMLALTTQTLLACDQSKPARTVIVQGDNSTGESEQG